MKNKLKYISSDTNVLLDFFNINKLDLPFRLPYIYLMNNDAIETEFLTPIDLKSNLLNLGLQIIEINITEFLLAESYTLKYKQLSIYDCIALAIAKNRNILLLTGDKRLCNAAKKEFVEVFGTLGILDQLYNGSYISKDEYDECLNEIKKLNGSCIRLPRIEIEKRLSEEGKKDIFSKNHE